MRREVARRVAAKRNGGWSQEELAGAAILQVFDKIDGATGRKNYVLLLDLRLGVPGMPRALFDRAVNQLRRAGRLTLDSAQGQQRLLQPAEWEAGIREDGNTLVWAARPGLMRANKAIPLDRVALNRETDAILSAIERALRNQDDPNEPLGTLPPRRYLLSKELRNLAGMPTVTGQPLEVPLLLVAVRADTSTGELFLDGAVGTYKDRNVLQITLNGAWSPARIVYEDVRDGLGSPLQFYRHSLYKILLHELTHLLDSPRASVSSVSDMRKYFNSPGEVRAYLQEIVDEVQNVAPRLYPRFKGKELVRMVLKLTPTWRRISPYLSPKNERLVLKAAYRTIDDLGLFPDTSEPLPA